MGVEGVTQQCPELEVSFPGHCPEGYYSSLVPPQGMMRWLTVLHLQGVEGSLLETCTHPPLGHCWSLADPQPLVKLGSLLFLWELLMEAA